MTAVALALLAGTGVALIVVGALRPRAAVAAERRGPLARIDDALVRAGVDRMPAVALLALAGVLGLLVGAAALAATGIVVLGAIGLVAGAQAPFALVRLRAGQRRRQNRGAWPDVVDHLVASVRSGLGLADAVEQLARTGPEPLRADFAHFGRRYRATGSFGHAVAETKERLADPTADRLLETLRMAREVGGTELVGVLRSLGGHLREEQAVRLEAEARQGWVLNAARLGVVAPWLVLLMLASRPEAAAAYNTPVGGAVILVGLGVSAIAYRLMLAIGRFRDEGRWFA
ncbi:MAG: type II secretion system protein F [Microbacteriaceae bacterium]|nr:type II secretion system protein F [Microbacteriaceae bacterium]